MLRENKSELCNAYCFCFEPQAKWFYICGNLWSEVKWKEENS